jgi:hypothetical protein
MVFVRAQVGPPNYGDPESMFTVQYFDEQGNMTIRSHGSRAWRCNNPGNLHASKYSVSATRRSIGTAKYGEDEYAVYPDYATGHEALIVMLRGSVYSPLSLRKAMIRFDRKNSNYINIIVKKTGLDPERKVKSLNDQEFEKFWRSIEETEKWQEGKEDPIDKCYITGVQMKHGVIYKYCVRQHRNDIWLSKQEAIALAQEWKIHAIVVHCSNGSLYLRPEYHGKRFREMVC